VLTPHTAVHTCQLAGAVGRGQRDVVTDAVRLLPGDRSLSEAEVSALLRPVHGDVAPLRRLTVDLGLVTRNGSSDYRRTAG
jgi:hypothetical protein